MRKGMLVILVMLGVSGCSTLKQNDQVAIYLDTTKGEYIPSSNIRNFVSDDYFNLSYELAVLSENIYRGKSTESKSISESCNNLDKKNDTRMPLPVGWTLFSEPEPKKESKWWILGESNGMEVEVWERNIPGQEPVVAIVFRGTDFTEIDDWYSNLRWITRINPTFLDQYDQTRSLIPSVVREIRSKYKNVKIVSTGHSLGGGLAQQASYVSDQISEVYAFSPSAVTGYFSVNKIDRDRNSRGVTIYRIYEKGEILGYLRGFMRNLSPLTKENPKLIEVGYNFSTGNSIEEHSMRELACGLYTTYGLLVTADIAKHR